MKYITSFVLVHCILSFAFGLLFNWQPWIVWKVLASGFQLGVMAIWVLVIVRILGFIQRN